MVKKGLGLLLALMFGISITGCGVDTAQESIDSNEEISQVSVDEKEDKTAQNRILVAYYSASGNTGRIAEIIAEDTEADIFEIVPEKIYTEADLDWTDDDSRVNREHNDEALQDIPLVTTQVEDFDSYDVIFIGYPIWWQEASWVVNNFVIENDFAGKKVIPFCTSSSSGIGDSAVNLAKKAGTEDWQEGIRFSESADESDVKGWLEELGY